MTSRTLIIATLTMLLTACGRDRGGAGKTHGSAADDGVAPAVDPIAAAEYDPPRLDAGVAAAGAADPCSPAAVRRVRKLAQAELDAGRAAIAVARLDALPCRIDAAKPRDHNAEVAWVISDLSHALYKAGDLHRCHATAEAQLAPYPGNVAEVFEDSDRVIRALQHNSSRCREALEQTWGAFASADCELAPDSHGIPADVLGALGARAVPSCLEIGAGTLDPDEGWRCGAVTLISRGGGTKPTRRLLKVPDSPLTDSSVCCNIAQVGFARVGAALRIRVDAEGRDCHGGTASSAETTIYQLTGDTLTVIDTLAASYH